MQLADGRTVDYDQRGHRHGGAQPPVAGPRRGGTRRGGRPSARAPTQQSCRRCSPTAPKRVLVIGGGFTGSEVASVCRELGLDVTLVERGGSPLAGALGDVIGEIAADLQRAHGVDLRTGVEVEALEGNGGSAKSHCPTVAGSTWTWSSWRSAPSATSSGCTARDWRPARSGSRRTPAAGRSTSTASSPTTSSSPATSRGSPTRCTAISSSASSTGERRRPGADRGAQHGLPVDARLPQSLSRRSGRSSSASTSSRSASRPSPIDPVHPRLEGGPHPGRRVRPRRAGRRSGVLRPGEVARLLPCPNRESGTVPARPARPRRAAPLSRSRSYFPTAAHHADGRDGR